MPRMSLRTRLLCATVVLAVTVTVLFGFVAYRITSEATVAREIDALSDMAEVLIRVAEASRDAPSVERHAWMQSLVEPMTQHQTLVEVVALPTRWRFAPNSQNSAAAPRATAGGDDLSKAPPADSSGHHRILQQVGTLAETSGRVALAGQTYLWTREQRASTTVTLVRLSNLVDETLQTVAKRLLIAGLAAIWIAVWAALILTAAISKRQEKYNETLAHRATHDALTGLPNRAKLLQSLSDAVADSVPGTLLLIDLDRFKEVNDTLGHGYGDELLRGIGDRLRRPLRERDLLARLGGDEFAIWMTGVDLDEGVRIANAVVSSLNEPLTVFDIALEVGASIGIARFPDQANSPEELLRCADTAMYVAKQERTGVALYATDSDQNSLMKLTLSGEMRRAIDETQFVLFYQPKVSTRDGRLIGAEALVRWQHPQYGMLAPDSFIGLAERSGFIHDFTRFVVEQAVAACAGWKRAGLHCPVAVNLSPYNLLDPNFVSMVLNTVDRYQLEPHMLELELTENAVMSDIAQSAGVFRELARHGIQLSIDDFGTGMSSFSYLSTLPCDTVKIDRSFVTDLPNNEQNTMIVRSIAALADNLGLSCVAEGVEDLATLQMLQSLGCDIAQGYYIGRPRPNDAACVAYFGTLSGGGVFADAEPPLLETARLVAS